MNTKNKGEISEGCVIAFLLKKGYSVSIPFGDNQGYDLILDDGKHLLRVQVKTARILRGCLRFNCVRRNPFTQERSVYRQGEVDIFLAYSPDLDKIYKVPFEETNSSEMTLRLEPGKRKDSKTRWAQDYEMK